MTSTTSKPRRAPPSPLFAGGQVDRPAGLRLCEQCKKGIVVPHGRCGFCGKRDSRATEDGDAP